MYMLWFLKVYAKLSLPIPNTATKGFSIVRHLYLHQPRINIKLHLMPDQIR